MNGLAFLCGQLDVLDVQLIKTRHLLLVNIEREFCHGTTVAAEVLITHRDGSHHINATRLLLGREHMVFFSASQFAVFPRDTFGQHYLKLKGCNRSHIVHLDRNRDTLAAVHTLVSHRKRIGVSLHNATLENALRPALGDVGITCTCRNNEFTGVMDVLEIERICAIGKRFLDVGDDSLHIIATGKSITVNGCYFFTQDDSLNIGRHWRVSISKNLRYVRGSSRNPFVMEFDLFQVVTAIKDFVSCTPTTILCIKRSDTVWKRYISQSCTAIESPFINGRDSLWNNCIPTS